MYVNQFDSHTHSENSSDGKHSVLHLCEVAEEKQIMGVCVTDHYDCNRPEGRFDVRIRNSVLETAKARTIYDRRIILTTGVEIGQATQNFAEAEKLIGQFKFDFILASLHNDKKMDDYYFVDFSGLNVELILEHYYEEMLELCRWNNFDSLAHLTYPLRYITGKHHIKVDMSQYDDVIREIFKTLAQNGKALEINTSGLRQEIRELIPTLYYAKMFRECGGEIITIGSDAHSKEDVGANIQDGMAMLLEAGFSYFAFYKKREPRMLKII